MTWDELAAEIARAIGKSPDDIPRRGTQEFNQLLGGLLDSHPDLAVRVQAWLVQSTERVPSQSEIAAEARKAEVRRRLGNLFTKADPTQPPRRRINKPVILATIAAAMAMLWIVGRLHSTPTPVTDTPKMPRTASTAVTRVAFSPPHELPVQNAPASQPQRSNPNATASVSTPRPASTATGLPPIPLPWFTPGWQMPPGQPPSTSGPAAGPQGTPVQNGTQVIVGEAAQSVGVTVVVATGSSADHTALGTSLTGTVVVSSQPAGATPSNPPAQGLPTGSAVQLPHFEIGDQFTVKLLTPIAVSPAWQALPAVAEAVDGPINGWQVVGSASQGQDGSLQITWTQAVSPDRKTTIPLHAVAYDPKVGKPGVPQATSSVMAPQAARTTLSGTLGAVSQYVQDEIEAQQVQVSGITATLTSQVPAPWLVLAQQLATGFQPAPVQTGGTILVTRVAAGTPVVAFITATQ